jgi:hypothetical protein
LEGKPANAAMAKVARTAPQRWIELLIVS